MSQKSPILSVQNVSKTYYPFLERGATLKGVLTEFPKLFSRSRTSRVPLPVLESISFDIYPGEFVGIMGRNGVGKSTLLKLMSGIYRPTSGTIEVHGQIAPLIELGAGFHPELSGYENIFLNAAILGFGKKATQDALEKIIEFSGLGEKIFLPTKNFSSGMLVRLGFSVAVHLSAPILLIDEILAVGDAGFQKKCLDKIQEIHAQGRTLVLITHDPVAVEKYCQRCIVLEQKQVLFDGPAGDGARVYRERFSG